MSYCNSCGSYIASDDICCAMCSERLERIIEYLRVLELPPGASQVQIKEAYRDLAKVWHPDRFDGDHKMKAKAHERFRVINNAYRELGADRQLVQFLETYVRNRHGAL